MTSIRGKHSARGARRSEERSSYSMEKIHERESLLTDPSGGLSDCNSLL